LSFCISLALAGSVDVKTSSGVVRGYTGVGVTNFLGIPYATAQRFGLPQPRTWNGILNATRWVIACPQVPDVNIPAEVMSEDCLYLHIITPMTITKPLPVMVWIHGGGFNSGAAYLYNGTNLVKNGNVIVVEINYRLAALGYFTSWEILNENPTQPTLGGMNGLLDQLFALEWINQNIAAFGGDPEKITLFGESAGGLSVCMLAASPLAKGLFKNIVIESGSCAGPWGPGDFSIGFIQSDKFLQSFNVTTLAQLRNIPFTLFYSSPLWPTISPTIDDYFLKFFPGEIFASGNSVIPKDGSIIIGSNTLDTLFGFPWYNGPFPTDNTALRAAIANYFGDNAQQVFNIYPGIPTPGIAWQRINTHLCLSCPTRTLTRTLAATHPVFLYEFGYNPVRPHFAGHFAEVPMVFGLNLPPWPYSPELSEIMLGFWTSFATNNVPTVGSTPWPHYQNASQSIYFDDTISVQMDIHERECSFWDTFAQQSPTNYIQMLEFCYQAKFSD